MAIVQIPLRNFKREIVDYALIDKEDEELVNKYSWHLKTYKSRNKESRYAATKNSEISGTMHQLIMGKQENGKVIDHININGLDNRRSNLQIVSKSQNNQNREMKDKKYSKFYGVTKSRNRWSVSCTNCIPSVRFNEERDAAIAYDKIAMILFGPNVKTNNLISYDEVVNLKLDDVFKIPKYIRKENDLYYIDNITEKSFNKLQDALKHRYDFIANAKFETQIIKSIDENVTYNESGKAIIKLINKEKDIDFVIVDADLWRHLSQYKWKIDFKGYITTNDLGNFVTMHRFLMKAKPGQLVDHINGDKHDNRLENLRFSNDSLNSHNRRKKSNATSKYCGLSIHNGKLYGESYKYKKTWKIRIKKNNKEYFIGYCFSETQGAMEYNKKAIELYGDFANLNVIPENYEEVIKQELYNTLHLVKN